MNISPVNQTAFSAKPIIYTVGESYLKTYDNQINAIKEHKQHAFELDHFMATDKEVKKVLDKLPEDDVVKLNLDFDAYDFYYGEFSIDDPYLNYLTSHAELPDELGEFIDTNSDGKVNKKGIIDWLNQIAAYLNK